MYIYSHQTTKKCIYCGNMTFQAVLFYYHGHFLCIFLSLFFTFILTQNTELLCRGVMCAPENGKCDLIINILLEDFIL